MTFVIRSKFDGIGNEGGVVVVVMGRKYKCDYKHDPGRDHLRTYIRCFEREVLRYFDLELERSVLVRTTWLQIARPSQTKSDSVTGA